MGDAASSRPRAERRWVLRTAPAPSARVHARLPSLIGRYTLGSRMGSRRSVPNPSKRRWRRARAILATRARVRHRADDPR